MTLKLFLNKEVLKGFIAYSWRWLVERGRNRIHGRSACLGLLYERISLRDFLLLLRSSVFSLNIGLLICGWLHKRLFFHVDRWRNILSHSIFVLRSVSSTPQLLWFWELTRSVSWWMFCLKLKLSILLLFKKQIP